MFLCPVLLLRQAKAHFVMVFGRKLRAMITTGILKGCNTLDNMTDRDEDDSPITASSGAVPVHVEEPSVLGPFRRDRAALWPVSGYPHESNNLYPRT